MESDRQLKQQYLYTHIVEAGHNTEAFAQYMNYVKRESPFVNWIISNFIADDGTNIDNWTLEGIHGVVKDFCQY